MLKQYRFRNCNPHQTPRHCGNTDWSPPLTAVWDILASFPSKILQARESLTRDRPELYSWVLRAKHWGLKCPKRNALGQLVGSAVAFRNEFWAW